MSRFVFPLLIFIFVLSSLPRLDCVAQEKDPKSNPAVTPAKQPERAPSAGPYEPGHFEKDPLYSPYDPMNNCRYINGHLICYYGGSNNGTTFVAPKYGPPMPMDDKKKVLADLETYKTKANENSHDATAYYNVGVAYAALGNYKEAIINFKKALLLDPKLAMAYYNLGNAYADLGQREDAVQAYKKVITLDPNHGESHYNLAVTYLSMGNVSAAKDEYNQLQSRKDSESFQALAAKLENLFVSEKKAP